MAVKNNKLLAFEGAQGFGAYTQGGRGGEIVKVTNLNESGKGSLRWALEDLDHPRIVVFEVGGTITLRDQIMINGDVTVAGQTAPGGITITGGRLRVVESEVIIRGLHVRPGDDRNGDDPDNRDGISIGWGDRPIKNVIIDSNSITWSVDEALTTWGNNSNITMSNNIVGEALRDSLHSKGQHGMGLLVGEGSSQVSIIGNLLAHNMFRNALVKDGSQDVEFINNVVYNYGNKGFTAKGNSTAHVINNVFIAGKDSTSNAPIEFVGRGSKAAYYAANNIGETAGPREQSSMVFKPATTDFLKTSDVLKSVLANVGADAGGRDKIDERIIDTVIDRNGKIIDSQKEVGGHLPNRKETGPKDSDGDGIPDTYEAKIGSNAKVADAHKDSDGNGFANIDDYINGLLDGFGSGSKGGQAQKTIQEGPQKASAALKEVKTSKSKVDDDASQPAKVIKTAASKTVDVTEKKGPAAADDAKDGASLKYADASGDSMLKASWAEIQRAELAFKGASGQYDGPQQASGQDADAIRIEAEKFELTGFKATKLNVAENGQVIQRSGNGEHQADVQFKGASGTYDILVNYFDEADGVSQLAIEVNGKEVDDWKWNARNGSDLANSDTAETHVIQNVQIDKGDTISLVGTDNGAEPLRIDAVEFVPDDLAFLA